MKVFARGFSPYTSMPARRNAQLITPCQWSGRPITAASGFSLASNSRKSWYSRGAAMPRFTTASAEDFSTRLSTSHTAMTCTPFFDIRLRMSPPPWDFRPTPTSWRRLEGATVSSLPRAEAGMIVGKPSARPARDELRRNERRSRRGVGMGSMKG